MIWSFLVNGILPHSITKLSHVSQFLSFLLLFIEIFFIKISHFLHLLYSCLGIKEQLTIFQVGIIRVSSRSKNTRRDGRKPILFFEKVLRRCALNLIGYFQACMPYFYNGVSNCMDFLEFNNMLSLRIVVCSMLMSCFSIKLTFFPF